VILLIGGELFARFYFGLGDPPLSMAHPTIEYLFKPSHTYHRFGNTIHYNAYSMRSPDFPKRKTDPRELRVMVLGDSVVNGGALSDDSDTVTAQLQRSLERELGRPVVVGNISAGDWGPPNLLAYVDAYGWFEADVIAVVLSSHDYSDAPTFAPRIGVDPNYPEHKPYFALQEAVTRYLVPRLFAPPPPNEFLPPTRADIESSTAAVRRLLERANTSGAQVVLVAQYPEKRELHGPYLTGHDVIRKIAEDTGVSAFDVREDLAPTGSEAELYIDGIHPSPRARSLMATALDRKIRERMSAGPTASRSTTTAATTGPTKPSEGRTTSHDTN
jgi:lysophospholipase L1-like esterase